VNQHDVKTARKKSQTALLQMKLLETVKDLEEAIKTFMTVEGKSEIHTEKFTISLVEGRLDITVRTSIDPNQLTLNFTNP